MTTKNNRTIIVFGLDKDGKPRAGSYPSDMAETAEKEAEVWKLKVGKAETDAALAIAKDLPSGEMFPSSKMELPIITRETHDLLLKKIKGKALPPVKPKSETAKPPDWQNLAVGDQVVAPDKEPLENGYWLATILSISKDQLKLRFVDSKLPPFTAHRHSVAILRPKQ